MTEKKVSVALYTEGTDRPRGLGTKDRPVILLLLLLALIALLVFLIVVIMDRFEGFVHHHQPTYYAALSQRFWDSQNKGESSSELIGGSKCDSKGA